jgi:hypothetical protein
MKQPRELTNPNLQASFRIKRKRQEMEGHVMHPALGLKEKI